jgi:cytochrome c
MRSGILNLRAKTVPGACFMIRIALTLALIALAAPALAAGDAENGKLLFRKCQACHKIGDGATNSVGPILTGVVGRKSGTVEGYSYSAANKNAGEQGLVWTEENLDKYLPDPSEFLKKFLTDKGKPDLFTGNSKMPFKVPEAADRADIIAYLKTFSK